MPQFLCRAKDRAGNNIDRVIDAESEQKAAAILRESGLFPIEIRPDYAHGQSGNAPVKESGSAFVRYFINPFWTGVNIRSLAFMFTQLSTLLKAGMSLSESLHSLTTRTGGRLGKILSDAEAHVRQGGRLSEVLVKHPRVFNTLIVSLIAAGETGGLMDAMIERISQNLEFELRIRRTVSRAMFYPYVLVFFIVFMPHVPTLFIKGTPEFWSEMAESLHFWVPALIISVIVGKFLFQFTPVRQFWDAIKLFPPVLGSAARKLAMSRFSRAMSALYKAGLPMSEVLRISSDACGNLSLGQRIKYAIPGVNSGIGLVDSLTRTGAVSPVVMDMLAVGERTGSYDAVLEKVAEHLETEAESSLQKTTIVLFVLSILVAGAIVLSIVLRFYIGGVANTMREGGL